MTMDGSFCIEYEVERFISRCPKLASIPQSDFLLKKGHEVPEEEVVNAVAELFLHPNYTIPLVGCFRPIARKIVDRAVSLLRLVPDLSSNSDDSMVEFDEDKFLRETESSDNAENFHVIDVYVRYGRGLALHELVCLAFCRALDLVPSLLGSVLNYFKFAPPPFKRIMLTESVYEPLIVTGRHVLNVVQASYRLLLAEPELFRTCWDWSGFLELVQECAGIDPGDNAELLKNILQIRWCGIQILAVILKLNDRATANFGLGAEEDFTCSLRWHEFCQDVSLEKAGWYLEPFEENKLSSVGETSNLSQGHCLQSFGFSSPTVSSLKYHEIPSNLSIRLASWNMKSDGNPFILTSAVKKSFEMVLLAVSERWPVLLYGPPGSGKTALISKLARDFGNRVLSIHMDEQLDGKTLVGSYVCTEQPGEFRWQPGSLTQAVLKGFWVVFEDIDKAPSDVQSILLPLLEGASSFFTGHGEAIRVADGFRLFSTISSSKLDISRATEGRNSLSALWRRVMVGPSSSEDLLTIVKAWYPDLEPFAGKLIETFGRINQLAGFQFGTSAAFSSIGRFSLRDLLKWCKRIAGLGICFVGGGLSGYVCNCIHQEAVDIFVAFYSSPDRRLIIMKEIAKIWPILTSASDTLYPVNRPVIQELHSELRIGRITLQRTQKFFHDKKPFVEIRSSLHVLERIACSVKYNEPVLLVGETGTGKTTLVQNLAMRLGQKLTVLNLSQQSDVADLLGGFKPMNAYFVCIPLYKEFENLFFNTFSLKDNEEFLTRLKKFVSDKNWRLLLSGFQKGVRKIMEIGKTETGTKRKRPLGEELLKAWEKFSLKLEAARAQITASSGMIFSFVEGAFVTALKNGEWILLDEVNLAPPETLQRVLGVLEDGSGSLCLAERGDVDYVHRHSNFRIFACMNPATDAGKRDLPVSLRSRFTEYFVDDVLDDEDLILFIKQFMDDNHSDNALGSKIVHFYKAAKKESEERLQDGANQKPQYSLRSLYRALEYTRKARRNFGFQKAIYDGFCMFFLTLLDEPSAKLMNQLILSTLLGGKVPPQVPFDDYLMVRRNSISDNLWDSYVLTKSVKEHLRNLARAIFIGRYPVLLQGPTSSGKTSLVQYLAAITGHEFVRINNHEHTDLQEYLGSYITDVSGKLVFHEGVLVKAVRNGYWIVLDELNLAPSDVLEALNRLLDDNRELFVPELHEVIRAHPDFMLFATQNPPTFYGGRKMLSRAFRNRFVEIHVDEIPQDELSTILEKRCNIPESYAKKMIEVMKELQLHRQSSKVFAGKHGFITPRDLFRWADRFRTFGKSYEDLARDGNYLLAEKLRDEGEKRVVQEVLERQLRVKLAEEDMYKQEPARGDKVLNTCKYSGVLENIGKIIWTRSMWKLYFLVERCYKLREPVLLVGETGGGKTTVCQLLSLVLSSKLHILNCHQYTETSDFLGGFYPVRERSKITSEFKYLCEQLIQSKALIHFPGATTISSDINQASMILNQLSIIMKSYRQGLVSHPDVDLQELDSIEQINLDLVQLHQKWQTIFMWQDGPLVHAMKNGDLFLVDEISLADDSVLERLNSVLEPERKLALAEKGGSELERITAHPNFFLLATMNPGGDYGKKELSPALRNRFTEIWVPPVCNLDELKSIALNSISTPELTCIVDHMLNFWDWFNQLRTGRMLTVRDLLSWVAFINVAERSLQPEFAFLHGAFLVLLDGLCLGTGISKSDAAELRAKCLSFLLEQLKECNPSLDYSNLSKMENYGWADFGTSSILSCSDSMQCGSLFGIDPFYIERGDDRVEVEGFEFLAPTTRRNALRVLRAMQVAKPVILEGSPGVGKTSLIVALGKFSGHTVVRINLSEQTDIMDLLGSDLPVESDEGMHFSWSDGILLQALKNGSWVLLDELNLAPQSVLEGLNAILDHRAEVFIPELGLTFKCPSSFRVFACQNPSYQGGGRKGLPKSFLNRFTKVYVDELVEADYLFICNSLYPSIPRPLLSKLILFNQRLYEDTMIHRKFGECGSPWEFNLRDVIRSCQIIQGAPEKSKSDCFLNTVYVQRMRTSADRREVIQLYEQVFGVKPFINPYPRVQLSLLHLIIGNTCIKRNAFQPKVSDGAVKILPGIRHSLEAVAHCVQYQWLCILIGPPSSGKTSLIRLLAQLTGNVLNELNLSSATDISELLGCFEQYNASRNYRLAIAQVECCINEYCSLQLESSTEAFERRKYLTAQWFAFLSSTDYGSTRSSTYVENWMTRSFDSVSLLIEVIEHLRLNVEKNLLPLSWSCKDLSRTLETLRKLQEGHRRRLHPAKFEWVTGLLIKAIENGEWIVLESANLCNPTVLDRINSLVEQSGSITLNECGTVDGKSVVLHPHPQFRMFLTVNPSYGEVSRAMRNRGVEICMMHPDWLLYEQYGKNCDETEHKDVKRFLVLSGIPLGGLVDSMAKAHIYARHEGLRLDVQITYLELARWVQLFQQLLTNGNRPIWSLHISWEHIYLSSLGEAEGKDIITCAIISYLSIHEIYKFDSTRECSLCLPGGWPTPLKLRDFVRHSREACVRQNCMYLEFLGATLGKTLGQFSEQGGTYLMDMKMLYAMMFPKMSNETVADYVGKTGFELALEKKKLLFAANWTIQQATDSDLELYLLRFSWVSSQSQLFCQFFTSFLTALRQELEHPIWNFIVHCHRELMSRHLVYVDWKPIPMLSMESVDFFPSDGMSESRRKLLMNAINCVGLLRSSYQQWNAESKYEYNDEMECFIPVLSSIQGVEKKVLDLILESPSFDVLFQLYTDLLEDHILFWNGITSSQFEHLLISWRSLIKDVLKLQIFCPREVENFLKKSKNLDRVSSWSFRSQKSLLWVHGGHPFLPSSADLYQKQHQLLNLCKSVWPRKSKSWEIAVSDGLIEAAVSSIPELRFLAMQGVCMSSYIMGEDVDDFNIVQQLEEMYQMLLRRLQYEKKKLEVKIRTTERTSSLVELFASCVFSPDILCERSGFDGWLDTLPLVDDTSFNHDTRLLQELSNIVLFDAEEMQLALSCLSGHLESSLNFSLKFSSRPPTDFLPHKKILWTLDAWTSVNAVKSVVSRIVLEMWFTWHTSLWSDYPVLLKNFPSHDYYDTVLPYRLFQPLKTAITDQTLHGTFAIRDYPVHSLKLRVGMHNLWQSSPHAPNISRFLSSAARSLFQQIIFAHKKSFEADKYDIIKAMFKSFQERKMTEADITAMICLLSSSSHHGFISLMDSLVQPLLRELYLQYSSTDLYSLACAWLQIGALRYHLLICCDDLDPAVKLSFKYSQLIEKIASVELETEVRNESVYLAGCFSLEESDKSRTRLLENLKAESKRLRRQIVFRSDPGKFKKLKHECHEFLKQITAVGLIKNIGSMDIKQVTDQVNNWQEIATRFIERLSNEYSGYADIVQPVQVAIYEMKLGLALFLSSVLQKKYLDRIGHDDMDTVLGTIYSFMRFPRGCASKAVSIKGDSLQDKLSSRDIDCLTNIGTVDIKLLESLITLTSDANTNKMVSVLQLKAAIHQNILLRVAHSIAEAQFMDNASFMLLHKTFDEFTSLWMNMKVQVKTKEDHEAKQYKFRPRTFKIQSIMEVDISTLGTVIPNESFSEWQELLSEEFSEKKADEEHESLEEDWNILQEPVLNHIVHIHNKLFGSMDLVQSSGSIQISDADRLSSFVDSYTLGIRMIKDLEGFSSSSLDAKLIPEHLLRLCLEHEQKFNLSHKSANVYNFYKDSNTPVMAKMVEPVSILRQKILSLLKEWDDHPALQKILDVIDMILAIPLSTSLAKVLSGLQFLLNRVQILQETVSKFPLSDQLEPIFVLVSSWQKLEFESLPALLDEVQAQFDINAGKLWFPLYSVLQHRHSADIDEYKQSTIQSLEEFIQTSSIGEFRKRLQLLFAFHGQISSGICWGSYSSPCQVEIVKILYNIFGFYMQLLPRILEHIEANRKSIDMELKDLLKLYRWERSENYLTLENSKRTRQKLKKLIQKYTDLLQQPVMLVLNKEAALIGIKTQSVQRPNTLCDSSERNRRILNVACNQIQFGDTDMSLWFAGWKKEVNFALQNFHLGSTTEFGISCNYFNDDEEFATIFRDCIVSQSSYLVYQEERKQVWYTIEKICQTAIDCDELWKDEKKILGKRRALSDLLKLLDSSGLSKHRSAFLEEQYGVNQSSRWLLQPSYDVQHLLLTQCRLSSGDGDVAALSQLQNSHHDNLGSEWKTANEYYFKSMASVHHLRHVCFNFHKDFTLEQVNRSCSYLDHLIAIQQEQRAVAYDFAQQLNCLRKCTLPLENLLSSAISSATAPSNECSFTQNQHVNFECMWKQKQLFDSMCSMMHNECLFLTTVENNHLNNCQIVDAEAKRIRLFIEKFLPDFQKSKDLLDKSLLGNDRVMTTMPSLLHPYGITKQMEQLVHQNFQLIGQFEENLSTFCKQDMDGGSVEETLVAHFKDLFEKGKFINEDYTSAIQSRNRLGNVDEIANNWGENVTELEARFGETLKITYRHIADAFHSVGSLSNACTFHDQSLANINMWKVLFESNIANLQLHIMCDGLVRTLRLAGELVDSYGGANPSLCFLVGGHLKHLYSLLNLVLTFSDTLLHDFLVMHRTVSIMTHVLANIFSSLYSKGFGVSTEEQMDDTGHDITQDAMGTGMGEGAGLNDVSDQINDEDQLLGVSEKPNEEQDALTDVPSKNDKGVEMEQDFAADTFSVSEESGDDTDKDGQDEQLESVMGQNGAESEIVDEKLWDKDDEENPSNTKEKYESGPSVKDKDPSSGELRGKQDSAIEAGELDQGESDKQINENGNQEGPDGTDDIDDMNIDKTDAFSDPTGLDINEPNQGSEDDVDMDDLEGADPTGAGGPEELNEPAENGKEETTNQMDETMEEVESEQCTENSEREDPGNNHEKNTEMDLVAPKKDVFEPSTSDLISDVANGESPTQPKTDSVVTDLNDVAPEATWSNCSDIQNDLAPIRGLPNASEIELTVAIEGGKLSEDQPKTQLSQLDSSSLQKIEPNPCRSVGDALEGWKERIKVSVDLQENNVEASDDLMDENAEEYGFTSEFEKGTAQALGPATSDQIDRNISGNDIDGDGKTADRKGHEDLEIEHHHSETRPIQSRALNTGNKNEAKMEISDLEKGPERSPEQPPNHHHGDPGSILDSLVAVRKSYTSDDILQFGNLSMSNDELGKAGNIEEVSSDKKDYAATLWRRYEMMTTRLSQELSEQLRLVMEPTLASKLQGDYKTGKRINMKKVIPYIASHYRKDKIWLRRTRPNKRDYQVVIAVDDSRSMSESRCGDVAIEAMVTLCRAMSQLEVGNLAVASFGKKGNIQLLHDFDQPFTGEAGIKMISSFTFNQENTIADEPMIDLLKYLNNMLDAAVANARLPSGQNPLQQLVLIIADGRFHEKENLKRCVRDILSKKRMVAFLLLDSPQESIMNLMEASFQGGNVKFSKYLDSFPFPYYVVLKNIEALPRTLADLLRQWFELMQYSRD